MNQSEKIMGLNLLVLLLVSGVIWLATASEKSYLSGKDGLLYIFTMVYYVPLHTIIALGVAFSSKEDRKAWLLSALMVLLLGFSVCLGGGAIR